MIDWSTAPEWAIGAAMDKSGWWFWYENKPELSDGVWIYQDPQKEYLQIIPQPIEVPDWTKSWVQKPVIELRIKTDEYLKGGEWKWEKTIPKPVTEPMTTEPMTTELTVDWSLSPKWAVGAAMDQNGKWYWYGAGATCCSTYWDADHLELITPPLPRVPDWRQSWVQKTYTKTMTTKPINDGGPAYPSGKSEKAGFENSHPLYEGMTLRDYFAGQALISMVGHSINIAKEAYQVADAMLEARTLKPE